jgi:hypothetical protein
MRSMSTMRLQQMQLEFPFMIRVIPWDGQYTFTHWVAKQCFDEAAREAKTLEEKEAFDVGPFYEPEIKAWAWVLETMGLTWDQTQCNIG